MDEVVKFLYWLNLPLQIGFGILIGFLLQKIWTRLLG
jgi:hypothetical protein